ncbi:phosphatidylinositol N-acetylglucosaminyltransferase subunit H-like [Telopea speciosissima]|uniref:phosphatidylinositol N-acetylglucosaminyltransferase subunit H-like n=1 Tax=Telopea speciosissima TaxID=54955 RepID=UPI001CC39D6A|nr:phosphatidylinositol N-acetylglucosaminyltransferase subunit H-like [Telopea speciosissima]XP_043709325.1 phosphatidylinositol N-acetylglucosaminyltransferase subunit H-like [Telopea speciosissima]
MTKVTFAYGRYTYIHDNYVGPFQAVDTHHVVVQRSGTGRFLAYIASLLLLANACNIVMFKENSWAVFLWSTLLGLLFAKSLHWKRVVKESVVVMPTFGVQLETHYGSGRIVHRFVPLGKILRPLLNECVTPVTCYWSLALIIRGESELMLVFQELRPPVKILIPIWKALCAATDSKESSHTDTEGDDH